MKCVALVVVIFFHALVLIAAVKSIAAAPKNYEGGISTVSSVSETQEAEWSYSGKSGPAKWGDLFPACSKVRQSPVEIFHDRAEPNENLTSFSFYGYDNTRKMENLTVWNDGYTVTVRVHGDLKIQGGGLEGMYSLAHFHFHWSDNDRRGSEHWLDGESYPLEMHLVHKSARHKKVYEALEDPSGLAVLGIFAKIGKFHPEFQAIIDNLRLLDIGDYANIRPFPLDRLFPRDHETFYRYQGSLTTPPCSESVVWTVFRQPIEISESQIQELRKLAVISNITENFRPLQELHGRTIYLRQAPAGLTGSGLTDDYDGGSQSHKATLLPVVVVLALGLFQKLFSSVSAL